ncbi:hypothetical protein CPT_Moabite_288 [Serratia phage Moabite]|uniref:Uncharacterized protein n=3 Tax=Moabitevirus TaxID=2843422 RepID=A0A7T3NBW8_9CAUD|nr:hypothetical protein HWB23_gp218 [Serratia phage vB_SmaM_ 2050HW]YP_009849382.1 hypothetical protein HWC48_gp128 [Serratia phage Moabite]QPX76866.1 hypothetical protein [Serratia phage vB_SmaM_Yaphecito]UCR74809.1 hypothetical protein [Serratia phage BUCT660]UGO54171.1 hypothetical protein HAYMO_189 [Serratia phage vB_SmaM_Haymo]UQT03677.1 hypothetical protein KODAMA_02100 [Serratia phage vB_SmaM-Kodama]ATA65553.1 hypothetical protein 2050HW_00218 [Serratia phage vB_SmaM_ 2050HW]
MTTSLRNDFPQVHFNLLSSYGLAEASVGFIDGQLKRNNGSLMALKANMVTNVARALYHSDYRQERTIGEIKEQLRSMSLYELGVLGYAMTIGEDNFTFGYIQNDEAPTATTVAELLREIQSAFTERGNTVADNILAALVTEYDNKALN